MAPSRRVAPKIAPSCVAWLGCRSATTGATRLVWHNFGQQRERRGDCEHALVIIWLAMKLSCLSWSLSSQLKSACGMEKWFPSATWHRDSRAAHHGYNNKILLDYA